MSLISQSAKNYLDRRESGVVDQLWGMSVDDLRVLLQMAQNEGQREVEQWVRDAMSGRGIYASYVPRQYTSGMNASDWLSKAMALILAGGILMGGPTLPVVDQLANQPAVTQVVDRIDITGEWQNEIAQMRQLARQVPGANPNAPVSIFLVNSLPEQCPSFTGCAFKDGTALVVEGRTPERFKRTVVHEIAHLLTPHLLGTSMDHGAEFEVLEQLAGQHFGFFGYG